MTLALVNGRILTDAGLVDDKVVLIEGDRIRDVVAHDGRWNADREHDLAGRLLTPGFIDTQVNGGGGVLFNDDPSVESIIEIGRAHRRFGTVGFLPTLISDDLHVVSDAIHAVQAAIERGVPGVLGIHIEGPYLNAERKGVHDASKLRWLDEDALGLLTSLKGGKTLVTLAPERTTPHLIQKLTKAGVIVSAGHTNATYEQVKEALAHGLSGFTHLFNAMSPLTSREPGVVGAALDDPNSWCGIILDGHHVDPVVLRIAMRSKRRDRPAGPTSTGFATARALEREPRGRFMLVTDAMPSVGAPSKAFTLQGRPISVSDNRCIDEDGRLAGADIDMATAVRNAPEMLEVDLLEAARMASQYPAEFLGLGHELGRIAPGYRASLALIDENVNVIETWIDGQVIRES
jgi:N-acetylglucosamine-6-phosphate deacetylase